MEGDVLAESVRTNPCRTPSTPAAPSASAYARRAVVVGVAAVVGVAVVVGVAAVVGVVEPAILCVSTLSFLASAPWRSAHSHPLHQPTPKRSTTHSSGKVSAGSSVSLFRPHHAHTLSRSPLPPARRP